MDITEIEINPIPDGKLLAGCSIIFDKCFAVREVKIVDTQRGPIVCMPTKKMQTRCPGCGKKNDARASWCNWCGGKLNAPYIESRDYYRDLAHPITNEFRAKVEAAVLTKYWKQTDRETDNGERREDIGYEVQLEGYSDSYVE
jgi:stage V sporulation protein G